MTRETISIAAFKVWIFPTLVSLVSLLIWNDVSTIKNDVKALMAQSNIDKTRIDNLERMVYKTASAELPTKEIPEDSLKNSYAVLPPDRLKVTRILYIP
jgi:hypothetical protein